MYQRFPFCRSYYEKASKPLFGTSDKAAAFTQAAEGKFKYRDTAGKLQPLNKNRKKKEKLLSIFFAAGLNLKAVNFRRGKVCK